MNLYTSLNFGGYKEKRERQREREIGKGTFWSQFQLVPKTYSEGETANSSHEMGGGGRGKGRRGKNSPGIIFRVYGGIQRRAIWNYPQTNVFLDAQHHAQRIYSKISTLRVTLKLLCINKALLKVRIHSGQNSFFCILPSLPPSLFSPSSSSFPPFHSLLLTPSVSSFAATQSYKPTFSVIKNFYALLEGEQWILYKNAMCIERM